MAARIGGAAAVIGLTTTGISLGAPATVAQSTADTFVATPTVGVLVASGGAPFCTASVVDSPAGDVLVTAAHCITGTGAGLLFEPGYESGSAPYGTWTVTAAYAPAGWVSGTDPMDDFVFLTVADQRIGGQVHSVESMVGGDQLVTDLLPGDRVDVVAYNDESGSGPDLPVSCTASLSLTGDYLTFPCDDYLDGSSGAPWLTAGTDGPAVGGVIGGLHQGGCLPDISYTAPFGSDAVGALQRAEAGGPGDTLPAAGPDGCTTGL